MENPDKKFCDKEQPSNQEDRDLAPNEQPEDLLDLAPRRSIPWRASVIEVTPDMAREISDKRYLTNRSISAGKVNQYIKSLRNGDWELTPQAIMVDEDGYLLDGHHRMLAIQRSGISMRLMIIEGVAREVFPYIDAGKSRSGRDLLTISDVPYPSVSAAAYRIVHKYRARAWTGYKAELGNSGLFNLYSDEPDLPKWASVGSRMNRAFGLLPGAAIAGLYLISRANPDADLNSFSESLATGAGLAQGSPLLALRNRTISSRARGEAQDAKVHLMMLLKAWNLWVSGEMATRITLGKKESRHVDIRTTPAGPGSTDQAA